MLINDDREDLEVRHELERRSFHHPRRLNLARDATCPISSTREMTDGIPYAGKGTQASGSIATHRLVSSVTYKRNTPIVNHKGSHLIYQRTGHTT